MKVVQLLKTVGKCVMEIGTGYQIGEYIKQLFELIIAIINRDDIKTSDKIVPITFSAVAIALLMWWLMHILWKMYGWIWKQEEIQEKVKTTMENA